MAIRRLNEGGKFASRDRARATVSTLPTVKAMRDCFNKYLNLTIADGNASVDTVKTYRNRVAQYLDWCKEREVYPALATEQNILEYRKYLETNKYTCVLVKLTNENEIGMKKRSGLLLMTV